MTKNLEDIEIFIKNKKSLELKKIPKYKVISILTLLIITIQFVTYVVGFHNGKSRGHNKLLSSIHPSEISVYAHEIDTLTKEKFVEYVKSLNINCPHIVMAQAIVESGLGKSKLYHSNFNLFGMKEARLRPTTSIGTANHHAIYESWRKSIDDYVLWQAYTNASKMRNDDEYYRYLSESGYAESPEYVDILKITVENNDLKSLFKK